MEELSALEKRRMRSRVFYNKHRLEILAKQKVVRESGNTYIKDYYAANKQEILAQKKAYYIANKQKLRAYASEHRKKHREEINKRSKKTKLRFPEKVILTTTKARAKSLGISFNLDLSDIVIPEFCPYLGIKLGSRLQTGRGGSSPSIDRVVPTLGYTKGNVAIISDMANRMKNNATKEQLLTFAASVFRLFGEK